MEQGEIWSAELPDPSGSEPGFKRPVVIVQGDRLNRSRLATVVVVPCTSNLKWGNVHGNVLLPKRPGLTKPSVANVSQVSAFDRAFLGRRLARVTPGELSAILAGIDFILGREA
jgi:mRNA interferase MazF